VCAGLHILGIPEAPAAADGDTVIATSSTGTAVVVVAPREDAEMARETRRLLGGSSADG